ncbi:MAG: protein kinase domain-containing protein [Acidimicrobiales bacterium]
MLKLLAGRYQLLKLLAQGGMAEVWEGRDEVLDRPVAVKVLLAHLAADATLQERFRREAVMAARLVHPGIVAVFDAGIEPWNGQEQGWSRSRLSRAGQNSTAFMVMELVQGETLRDLIARAAPLPVGLAVAITAQVASALGYAHSQGLVHRDVKPANVLLSEEGPNVRRVKVTDFGIAKAVAAAGADLTASGTIMGTPKYLAPEQVEGLEPDARADLYSLGVVLFEMLAGKPPFIKGSDVATALARLHEPVPRLDELRADIPAGLADLVSWMLARDPGRRVPSAFELNRALAAFNYEGGVAAGLEASGYFSLAGSAYMALSPGLDLAAASGPALSNAGGPASFEQGPSAAERSPTGGAGAATCSLADPTAGTGEQDELGAVDGQWPAQEVVAKEAVGQTMALSPAPRKGAGGVRGPTVVGTGRRGGRPVTALVLSLVVVGLLVVAALVASSGLGTGSQPGASDGQRSVKAPAAPIAVQQVSELTQGGNLPDDHLGELHYLIDGNPKTVWESDVYDGPDFGGWGGFGLVMRLAKPRTLHQLRVLSPMQDWSAETFVQVGCPSRLVRWGRPTDERTAVYGDATFSLGGSRGNCVLLWMLNPGPSRQAVIAELSLS